MPSWKAIESSESFQVWLRMPCELRRLYSTKPSPSRSAGAVDPGERPPRRVLQLERQGRIVGPAPGLRQEHEEERRRVDGAVVAVGPGERRLAAPQLVHDLAGLGVALGVVGGRLGRSEDAQRSRRQLGAEQQRLQRRDQRVPAEDGHEPRRAGGEEVAVGNLGYAHPQRGEIRERPVPGMDEVVPAPRSSSGAELCHSASDCVACFRSSASSRANDAAVSGSTPSSSACTPTTSPQRAPGSSESANRATPSASSNASDRWTTVRPANEPSENTSVPLLERSGGYAGGNFASHREPEAGLEVLDDEDVGEVGSELQPELDVDPARTVVLDRDALLHAVADEALALDHELVRPQAAGERVPQHERREVRRGVIVRERIEARAAERQHRAREEARVGGEEARRGGDAVDVAALVADAEGRAVENRERQWATPPARRLAARLVEEQHLVERHRERLVLAGLQARVRPAA